MSGNLYSLYQRNQSVRIQTASPIWGKGVSHCCRNVELLSLDCTPHASFLLSLLNSVTAMNHKPPTATQCFLENNGAIRTQ